VTLKALKNETPPCLELTDVKSLIGSYCIRLKREFFARLLHLIKKKKNYTSHYAVEKVENSLGEDWSNNSWYLIVGLDRENLPYWLLIKQEPDESGIITGVGPEGFTNIIKEKGKGIFETLIYWVLEDPERWRTMAVLVN